MKLTNITNKKQLNDFVGGQPQAQFLQSWEWGEFQKQVSGRVWRLGAEDGGRLIASAKLIEKVLPMGKRYFYCGRGPVIDQALLAAKPEIEDQSVELIFNEVEKIARNEKVMFLRFDPLFKIYHSKYRIRQTHSVQPRMTIALDIAKSEDALLAAMHQKTRYNIGLAEKKGVEVVEAGKERFEEFWHLLDQTSGRDKFRPHGRNYYQTMLEIPSEFLKLFFAEYKGKPVAAGIFSFFGDTVAYLHGGSANELRNIMTPFALQWHAIRSAKSLGFRFYDFHGIDPEKYPGVTRFKRGFGGEEKHYPGTFDLVYDEGWYSIYKMIRKVRRTF